MVRLVSRGWEEALWLPSLTVGEIGEMPSETGDEGWTGFASSKKWGEGGLSQSQGAPFKQITHAKKSNRLRAWNKHWTKNTLSIGWHPEAAKHQRTEKWGQRKSGCEDRVLSTRGAGWGRSGGPGGPSVFSSHQLHTPQAPVALPRPVGYANGKGEGAL